MLFSLTRVVLQMHEAVKRYRESNKFNGEKLQPSTVSRWCNHLFNNRIYLFYIACKNIRIFEYEWDWRMQKSANGERFCLCTVCIKSALNRSNWSLNAFFEWARSIESEFDLCVKPSQTTVIRGQYSDCHSLGETLVRDVSKPWSHLEFIMKFNKCANREMNIASLQMKQTDESAERFAAAKNVKNLFYTLRTRRSTLGITRASSHTKTHHNSAIRSYYSVLLRGLGFSFLLYIFILFPHQNDLVQCWKCELCATEWQLQRSPQRASVHKICGAQWKKNHKQNHSTCILSTPV